MAAGITIQPIATAKQAAIVAIRVNIVMFVSLFNIAIIADIFNLAKYYDSL